MKKNIFYGRTSSKKSKNAYKKIEYLNPKFNFPPAFKQAFINDPKWILFSLSRYKFVSKLLKGKNRVLEIGCWDGACSMLVAKNVNELYAIDFYRKHVDDAKKFVSKLQKNIFFSGEDFLDFNKNYLDKFDAIYSVDVLEHIDKKQEKIFFNNALKYLKKDGILITGTPSKESQKYASIGSRISHINCKTGQQLKDLNLKYFENCFLFSMNDEVIHTGYEKMANYLFTISTCKKAF